MPTYIYLLDSLFNTFLFFFFSFAECILHVGNNVMYFSRSIALLIIAIERFKFIAKRWTGKRVIAKALYASPPKRSQSASNNNWTVLRTINFSSNTQPKNYLPSPTTTQQPKQSQLTRLQNLFHDTQQ